ncbi:MAG: ABC transporter ATP-binding protein [Betaproteobacteria bacterium]|nr:ABC transporter ATP-binding protein [Betaproteobacteria bacterium]
MTEMLRLSDVHAHYGESHILHGVNMHVNQGEVVTLLGRNGAGRTTTLKAILGLVGKRTGSIKIKSQESVHLPPHQIARLGIGFCPEERGIFASLSCEENLLLPPKVAEGGGTRLSGGEQQMLSVARILRTGAGLLLLDEISEGLAPVIVQALGRAIRMLREKGFTIVMVEQNFRFAAPLADRFYVIEHGTVVEAFSATELESKSEMLKTYLGV